MTSRLNSNIALLANDKFQKQDRKYKSSLHLLTSELLDDDNTTEARTTTFAQTFATTLGLQTTDSQLQLANGIVGENNTAHFTGNSSQTVIAAAPINFIEHNANSSSSNLPVIATPNETFDSSLAFADTCAITPVGSGLSFSTIASVILGVGAVGGAASAAGGAGGSSGSNAAATSTISPPLVTTTSSNATSAVAGESVSTVSSISHATTVSAAPSMTSIIQTPNTDNTGVRELDSLLLSHATWLDTTANPGATSTLTYAIENLGANLGGNYNASVADQQFNATTQSFYRSVFTRVSELTNLNLVESTSQNDVSHGGADIRIFASSRQALGQNGQSVDYSLGGWAFMPSGDGKGNDILGNIYMPNGGNDTYSIKSIAGLTNVGTYDAIHEIGHAFGLGHPFNDGALSTNGFGGAGQQPYSSTQWVGKNNFGELTGGAYDSANLDQPIESVMGYRSINGSSHTALSTDFGLWDVAALQHIYGANMSFHAGDDTYTFSGLTGIQTLWDAGGTNTIQSVSHWNSIINLNQGAFSRVGDLALVGEVNTDHLLSGSASIITPNAGQLIEESGKLYINWNPEYTGDATIQYTSTTDNLVHRAYNTFNTAKDGDQYNLAIAYGTIIANAIGGDGDDIIISNSSSNVMTGGAGKDTFEFSGLFGNDTITDFTQGQDVIKLDKSFSDKTSFSNGVLSVQGYGSISLSHVSNALTAGTDYMFVL